MYYILKTIGLAALGAGILSSVASSQGSLTTTFASNNGFSSSGAGNMFDVDVKNTKGLKITSFDVNSRGNVGVSLTLDVYITPTTYVGVDTTPNLWVKVATGTGLVKGRDIPTPVNTSDFFLAPGNYGMYLLYTNPQSLSVGPGYTNGTGTNQKYSNSDLALALGIAHSKPYGGSRFDPRVWNGTIYYAANDSAASGAYGYGCPGSNQKVPKLSLSADPVLGTTINIDVTEMLNTIDGSLLFLGFQKQKVDLALIGMPKCTLFTTTLLTLGFANVNGKASIPAPIPANVSLIGGVVHSQSANRDKTANTLGYAASNGLSMRLGK